MRAAHSFYLISPTSLPNPFTYPPTKTRTQINTTKPALSHQLPNPLHLPTYQLLDPINPFIHPQPQPIDLFSFEYFPAFLGCLRAGAIACPVYPIDPSKMEIALTKFKHVVEDTGARVVLTDKLINRVRIGCGVFYGHLMPKDVEWRVTDHLVQQQAGGGGWLGGAGASQQRKSYDYDVRTCMRACGHACVRADMLCYAMKCLRLSPPSPCPLARARGGLVVG